MKLTEESWGDFEQLIAGKYNTIGIDFTTNDEQKLEQLKQQILKNQEIIESLPEIIRVMKKFSDSESTTDYEKGYGMACFVFYQQLKNSLGEEK